MFTSHKVQLGAAAALALTLGLTGCAQTSGESEYPQRDIKIVVPFAAGSATDVVARVWAECYERKLEVPVNIENRAGGSGAVGMTEAAGAKPDGYTLVQASTSSGVYVPHFTDVNYSVDSFDPFGVVAMQPTIVIVGPESEFKSMDDVLEAGKTRKLAVSDSGANTTSGLVTEIMANNYGFEVAHVTPSSVAETRRGLQQGDYDIGVVSSTSEIASWVADGSVRALAIGAAEPPTWAPEVPTLEETGYGDGQLGGPGIIGYWAAPSDTPESVVEVLKKTNSECTKDAGVAERIGESSMPSKDFAPEEILGFLQDAKSSLESAALK